jgi:phosphoribosyl 1,2-cyclic phosphodiesterase
MRFASLSSGSNANCFFIESEDNAVLIDCGISARKVETFLDENNIDLAKIKAVLITHEHTDHIRHIKRISAKFKAPVYISPLSYSRLSNPPNRVCEIKSGCEFKVGGLKILPVTVAHDAANTFGFRIVAGGKKMFFASDIGSFDNEIVELSQGANLIAIEANFDPEMLRVSDYHYLLKQRIAGGNGHLSNYEAVRFLRLAMNGVTDNVFFLHLSENNNNPTVLRQLVLDDLKKDFSDTVFRIASRKAPSPIVEI